MLFQISLPGPNGPMAIPKPPGFKFAGASQGSLAAIFNEALKYIFPLAGLSLFFMLIAGGFQLMTTAHDPETVAKAYKKILFALIGFLVIFFSYWIIQILEHVLGINVLGF